MSKGLRVPERVIPIPEHLSPDARARLSQPRPPGAGYPALDDAEGWKQHIAAGDAMIAQMFAGRLPEGSYSCRDVSEGEAKGYEIIPQGASPNDRRVYLYIHGGALIMGGGEACKAMSAATAIVHKVRMISVDYRMPPDHPYPVGLDDCMAFYRAVLRDHAPHEIIVGGGSAGGNLTAAMLLKARDEGLPMPAAAVLVSPELDLTESGDTHQTNAGIDAMGSLMQANLLYANGADLTDPYISPLFGDVAKGFPPTIIAAGTRDLFLSNSARFHRKLRAAGVPAELHVIEAAPHGNFGGGTPEEAALDEELRSYCEAKWSGR